MSCTCTCVGTCTCVIPSRAVQVPSPEPPWRRSTQIVSYEVIVDTDNISLTSNPTLLEKAASSPSVPVTLVLPDGNHVNQSKTILIEGDNRLTTETFNVTGTFNGFTSLRFDAIGFHAVLVWDGSSWSMIGGNATTV